MSNGFSKTGEPCDCGWLSHAINDSDSGVTYGKASNLIYLGSDQSRYPLYHCPSCGGCFPDSSKPMWVPIVPVDEEQRLEALINGLATVDDILNTLGTPDYDALTSSHVVRDGVFVEGEKQHIRNIEYYQLSEWLNLEYYVLLANGSVNHKLVIKSLSPRHLEST